MFSWESDFEDAVRTASVYSRKLKALRRMMENGKVSGRTVEFLQREFNDYVKAIEARKQTLLERLGNRLREVQQLIELLERLMAENEMRHSVGEVPDEKYNKIAVALSSAFEESMKEHESLKEAISILARLPELTD
ncbi:MAG: CdvA-like protein [Candidatus Brockarchaeota archaeon]|nr:CdvA-like protein [Candidatus Brockarchaeota archaeon]MBO3809443.1 CdvA-like protein [Candidatus Brockarchaeota archaeon]